MILTGPGYSLAIAELEVQTGVFRVEMESFVLGMWGKRNHLQDTESVFLNF